jgi:hypothetical protein
MSESKGNRRVMSTLPICGGALSWWREDKPGEAYLPLKVGEAPNDQPLFSVSFVRGTSETPITSIAELFATLKSLACDYVADARGFLPEFSTILARIARRRGRVVVRGSSVEYAELEHTDFDVEALSPSLVGTTLSFTLFIYEQPENANRIETIVVDLSSGHLTTKERTLSRRPLAEVEVLKDSVAVPGGQLFSTWRNVAAFDAGEMLRVWFRSRSSRTSIASVDELTSLLARLSATSAQPGLVGVKPDKLSGIVRALLRQSGFVRTRDEASSISARFANLEPPEEPRLVGWTLSFAVLDPQAGTLTSNTVHLDTSIVQSTTRQLTKRS